MYIIYVVYVVYNRPNIYKLTIYGRAAKHLAECEKSRKKLKEKC